MLAEVNPAHSTRGALGALFSRRRRRLRLLPKRLLVETGPVDHAEWNSRLFLGWISRQRFRLVQSQLAQRRIGRLLEIGYGSGVFLPELAEHSRELFGLDVHNHQNEVAPKLAQYGVQAQLYSGTAEDMPFSAGHFDVVVAVSCLEFIGDLAAAAREISRVLAPDGIFIVVTPNTSGFVDAGFRLLTGKSAEADFQGRRQRVVPTLLQYFDLGQCTVWPPRPVVPLYRCLRLRLNQT